MAQRIAFVDVEASSLSPRSYPIEIGWIFADGASEGHLIVPHEDWLDWDPCAQDVHGLSRRHLFRSGRPGPFVAERIIAALVGCRVFSDAPAQDNFWLSRLFDAVGSSVSIRLEPLEQLFGEMARSLLVSVRDDKSRPPGERALAIRLLMDDIREALEAARGTATIVAPKQHRAIKDARRLREAWIAFEQKLEAMSLLEESGP
jgi:hypothetical protein